MYPVATTSIILTIVYYSIYIYYHAAPYLPCTIRKINFSRRGTVTGSHGTGSKGFHVSREKGTRGTGERRDLSAKDKLFLPWL